jgi:hypothetical protein
VTLNNHAANRKAQSYAMRLSREKRIKEAAQPFRIKSRPRIFDRDENRVIILEPCPHLQHPISIRSVIHCLNCILLGGPSGAREAYLTGQASVTAACR